VCVCVCTCTCVCSCIYAVRNNFMLQGCSLICGLCPLFGVQEAKLCLDTRSVLILRRKVGKTPAPLCPTERAVLSLLKCWIDFWTSGNRQSTENKDSFRFIVLNHVYPFFSSKKSHEDTKDKEPAIEVKEEKSGIEGMYTPLYTLVSRSSGQQ